MLKIWQTLTWMALTLRKPYTLIEKGQQRKNVKKLLAPAHMPAGAMTAMVKAKKVDCQSSPAAPSGLQPRTWNPTTRRMFRIGTGVRYASWLAGKKTPIDARQGRIDSGEVRGCRSSVWTTKSSNQNPRSRHQKMRR